MVVVMVMVMIVVTATTTMITTTMMMGKRGEGANILLKQDGLELAKARTDYLFHPFGELTEGEVCPTMLELDWL